MSLWFELKRYVMLHEKGNKNVLHSMPNNLVSEIRYVSKNSRSEYLLPQERLSHICSFIWFQILLTWLIGVYIESEPEQSSCYLYFD